MLFYTYVLKSQKDGGFYVEWTKNINTRLIMHYEGKVKATKYRRPLNLVYFEACNSEAKAITREKQLKTGFGRTYLKRRI